MDNLRAVIAAWRNTYQRSKVGVRMDTALYKTIPLPMNVLCCAGFHIRVRAGDRQTNERTERDLQVGQL